MSLGGAEWGDRGVRARCTHTVRMNCRITSYNVCYTKLLRVDHPGAPDQSRVGMGINVEFHRGVHGDTTEAPDRFRSIGDGQGTQHDFVLVFIHVVEVAGEARGFRQGQRAGGREVQAARVEQIEHGVLQHFGVDGQVVEGA